MWITQCVLPACSRSGHGSSWPPHRAAAALWRRGPADGAAEQLDEGRTAECDQPQPHTPYLPTHGPAATDKGRGWIKVQLPAALIPAQEESEYMQCFCFHVQRLAQLWQQLELYVCCELSFEHLYVDRRMFKWWTCTLITYSVNDFVSFVTVSGRRRRPEFIWV